MTEEKLNDRLTKATEACLKFYDAWQKDRKNIAAKQQLEEAVHELRKVTARMEIELAIVERGERSHKPIPIPSHRSSNKMGSNGSAELVNENNDANSNDEDSNKQKVKRGLRKPSTRSKKSSEG